MQPVHTFTRLGAPPTRARTRWMLGFQRRFVRRCECDTDMPHEGPLPQTSHTDAIVEILLCSARPCRGRRVSVRGCRPNSQCRLSAVHATTTCLTRDWLRSRDDATGTIRGVPTLERLDVHALRSVVTTFRDTVKAHQAGINRLNVYPVPDGDTGTNMARTLDAVVAEMEGAPAELQATCDAISHGSL